MRIFEALHSFVQSQNPALRYGGTPIANENVAQTPRGPFIPSQVSKAKLLLAVHEVEDIYVAYAEDTIERVVEDVKKHRADPSNYPRSSSTQNRGSTQMIKYELRKNFAISVNLLANDVQNFANLYRAFMDRNPEWFDLNEEHTPSGGRDPEESEMYVPVVPQLSSAFF